MIDGSTAKQSSSMARIFSGDGWYSRSALRPGVSVMPTPGAPISTMRSSRSGCSPAMASLIRPPSELPTREVFSMPSAFRNAQT